MKTKLAHLLFCCLMTAFSIAVFSQKPHIRFEQLSTTESFSQNMVTCILKDRYGFLWFGTDDGLGKYDGYKIVSYRNDPKSSGSIGSNIIHDIYEDSKGRLWVGTDGGGLNLYDRNTNAFIRFVHSDTDPLSIRDNSATKIREDKKGNLWIGTYYGLDLMTDPAGKFRHYEIQSSKVTMRISALECDSQNNLWIGTHTGLAVMDHASQKFRLYRHDNKNKNSLSDDLVNSIIEDDKKNIWIATQDGLNLARKDGGGFVHFVHDKNTPNSIAHNTMRSFAKEENGRIWIGTEMGLDLFDPEEQKFYHTQNVPGDESSLPHNSLRCTYVDPQGTLWLGCVAGGVRKYDKKLSQFRLYKPLNSDPATLNLKMAFSFAETKAGDIWIGTDGGGLNLFRKKDASFLHIDYNENDPLHSLLSRTIIKLIKSKYSEDVWIGTYGGGLSCYHPSTNTFTHYTQGNDSKHLSNQHVYALLEDRNGNIWAGTNDGGLNVLDKTTNRFIKFPYGSVEDGDHVTNSCIRALFEDTDGKIWIGTYGAGINVYNPATKKFTYLTVSNGSGLNNNIVLSIYRDSKGNIWAGTMGGGLNLYDKKKHRFTHFTEEDGLSNNVVNSILEDNNGFLWLSTKKGISRFDPITKKFKNYGVNDGLQGYEFLLGSGFTSSTGEMYFGGVNGFNVFDPSTIRGNVDLPPIVITGFQLFNKPVSIGEHSPLKKDILVTDSITLPYDKSMISFDFAALNFTAPEKNQYAYKLDGFDKDWIYCGNSRTATYTNLDPGEYTFKVKASNNDGLWNEKATSIKIIITPPFWQTWWFKLMATVTLLIAGYLVYKIRMKAINHQKAQLEQQVQERTQNLAQMTIEERKARREANEANKELERKNKELEQFAYVASHDMQEPLRTISSFVDLLNSQYKDRFDERAQKYMTYIVQGSDRMKVLINDLLEYSRIGKKREAAKINLNETVNAVLQDLSKAIADAGAIIEIEDLPIITAYPTEIKQLFQNLIVNAIKFRKKGTAPRIKVAAKKKDGEWQFMVHDNGIGIEPEHSDRIFVIFQRLHTRNEYEGSGIGLSHCKKIAELHKGKIWVESTPGEGSSFFFTVKEQGEISLS